MKLYSSSYKSALYSAFIVPIIPSIILFFLTEWYWCVLIYLLQGCITYFIFRFILNRFIYRKIKVIYKNIHRFKTSQHGQRQYDDPVEEVSSDVFNWAKEQRNEIAELKRQETFRREFIGNLSHELKTPLFQLQGYIHTLLDGALNDEKVNEKFLKRTAKSADRMVELVNDLNNIGRLESGEAKLEIVNFEIRELVEEVYEELDFMAQKESISLDWKKGDLSKSIVSADRKQIKQVLINLISNGIKYGRENGQIRCGIYDMDNRILFEVTDDGLGIAAGDLPRLFERFYRVEKSRTRDEGGSGLGLSIAKHIIVAHGQSIDVRSEEQKGSTFSFTLEKG